MAEHSIWPATNGPGTDTEDLPVIAGHIFRASATFWVLKIRFYRGTTNITGTPKGRIFAVATETVVPGTQVDFNLSGTGWQEAELDEPIHLSADTSYKVAVHYPSRYTATGNYWSSGAGVGGITNGILVAPDAGGNPLALGSIQQGSFRYTSDPDLYPNSYFQGGNYWVDLVITDTEPEPEVTNKSISDQAREGMLDELVLDEPQLKSNTDLMREVIADETQTLITVTQGSAAAQLIRYEMSLRS